MGEGKLRLELLPDIYAVCRLDADAPVPDWVDECPFSSITRTASELSVVCPDVRVASAVKKESGWRILTVEGPLDFALTGVLASLVVPLSRKGVSVFTLSTYDTDHLLVKNEQLDKAIQVLRDEGHDVEGAGTRQEGPRGEGEA